MIILNTHIWIWWVDENPKLSPQNLEIIRTHQSSGLGISIISCWAVAKLVERGQGRSALTLPLQSTIYLDALLVAQKEGIANTLANLWQAEKLSNERQKLTTSSTVDGKSAIVPFKNFIAFFAILCIAPSSGF